MERRMTTYQSSCWLTPGTPLTAHAQVEELLSLLMFSFVSDRLASREWCLAIPLLLFNLPLRTISAYQPLRACAWIKCDLYGPSQPNWEKSGSLWMLDVVRINQTSEDNARLPNSCRSARSKWGHSTHNRKKVGTVLSQIGPRGRQKNRFFVHRRCKNRQIKQVLVVMYEMGIKKGQSWNVKGYVHLNFARITRKRDTRFCFFSREKGSRSGCSNDESWKSADDRISPAISVWELNFQSFLLRKAARADGNNSQQGNVRVYDFSKTRHDSKLWEIGFQAALLSSTMRRLMRWSRLSTGKRRGTMGGVHSKNKNSKLFLLLEFYHPSLGYSLAGRSWCLRRQR